MTLLNSVNGNNPRVVRTIRMCRTLQNAMGVPITMRLSQKKKWCGFSTYRSMWSNATTHCEHRGGTLMGTSQQTCMSLASHRGTALTCFPFLRSSSFGIARHLYCQILLATLWFRPKAVKKRRKKKKKDHQPAGTTGLCTRKALCPSRPLVTLREENIAAWQRTTPHPNLNRLIDFSFNTE